MLDILGTLTMGSAGEITNSGSDYSINDNGISFDIPNDTLEVSKSATWRSGNSVVAQIGAARDTGALFDFLEYQAGYHSFQIDGNQVLGLQDNLAFFNKPPVVPRLTTTERDNLTVPTGTIIFNTNANRFQGKNNNGDWKDLSQ